MKKRGPGRTCRLYWTCCSFFLVWRDINRSSHRRSLWIKAIDQLHSTAAPAWHPDFAGAKMTETWRAPRIQLATCLKRWIPLRFSLWFWSFSIARKACEPGIRSYHIADMRGCSIDQPRNLAKSVTVEWSRLKWPQQPQFMVLGDLFSLLLPGSPNSGKPHVPPLTKCHLHCRSQVYRGASRCHQHAVSNKIQLVRNHWFCQKMVGFFCQSHADGRVYSQKRPRWHQRWSRQKVMAIGCRDVIPSHIITWWLYCPFSPGNQQS